MDTRGCRRAADDPDHWLDRDRDVADVRGPLAGEVPHEEPRIREVLRQEATARVVGRPSVARRAEVEQVDLEDVALVVLPRRRSAPPIGSIRPKSSSRIVCVCGVRADLAVEHSLASTTISAPEGTTKKRRVVAAPAEGDRDHRQVEPCGHASLLSVAARARRAPAGGRGRPPTVRGTHSVATMTSTPRSRKRVEHGRVGRASVTSTSTSSRPKEMDEADLANLRPVRDEHPSTSGRDHEALRSRPRRGCCPSRPPQGRCRAQPRNAEVGVHLLEDRHPERVDQGVLQRPERAAGEERP